MYVHVCTHHHTDECDWYKQLDARHYMYEYDMYVYICVYIITQMNAIDTGNSMHVITCMNMTCMNMIYMCTYVYISAHR